MSEDLTKKLPPQSFEERVLAEFAQLNARLDKFDARLIALEEKVDERLRETRPIWEGVLQRLTQIETTLSDFNRQVRSLIADMYQMRLRVEKLEDSQPNV